MFVVEARNSAYAETQKAGLPLNVDQAHAAEDNLLWQAAIVVEREAFVDMCVALASLQWPVLVLLSVWDWTTHARGREAFRLSPATYWAIAKAIKDQSM